MKFIHLLFIAFMALAAAVTVGGVARGEQEPEVILTWRASAYAPPDFQGRILPAARSSITASVELLDRSSLVNLSRITIYWYLNDEFLEGGAGKQTVRFNAGPLAGRTLSVRAQIPEYRGGTPVKTVELPVMRPEAVIVARYARREFSGTELALRGAPYFFNAASASDLKFSWSVNGKTPSSGENPEVLDVNLGTEAARGSTISVKLTVENTRNNLEAAFVSREFTLRK